MRGSAAMYYHPEGFDNSGSKLMGEQAAGEAYLKAYAEHGVAHRTLAWLTKLNVIRVVSARKRISE